MARRILFGVVVVMLLISARLFFARPVPVELELDFGPQAAAVRSTELVFTDGKDHVARDLELRYPTGAPQPAIGRVTLKPGDYQVGVRVSLDGAPARTFARPLHVAEAGRYPLPLTD